MLILYKLLSMYDGRDNVMHEHIRLINGSCWTLQLDCD